MTSQPVDGPPVGSTTTDGGSISSPSSSTLDSSSPIHAPGLTARLGLLDGPDNLESHQSNKCGASTNYVILASTLAAFGGVLFGYDVGIISGALLQLASDFNLDCLQQELIVSSMLIGAVLASLTGGFIVDYCGRRTAIIGNSVIFIVGALMLSFAQNYVTLIIGRLVVGYGVSLSAIAECVYISEIAPAKHRGLLVSLNELGISSGFLVSYLVNLAFIKNVEGWRLMFGLSAVPAALQGIGMFFLPPSPRFLMIQGKEEQTRKTLTKLRGTSCIETEVIAIRDSLITQQRGSVVDLCQSSDNMRLRLLLGLGVVFFQQFTGQPSILYYAPTLLLSIGFESNSTAMMSTVGLGIVKLVFTVITLIFVDRVGRRKFLLGGTAVMMVGIGVLGFLTVSVKESTIPPKCSLLNISQGEPLNLHYLAGRKYDGRNRWINDTRDGHSTQRLEMIPEQSSLSQPEELARDIKGGGNVTVTPVTRTRNLTMWPALIALMTFVAGYALGFGPVTWLLLSEIYPSNVRGRAISLATVCNWGSNLLISLTLLDLMRVITVPGIFLMYAAILAVAIVFIFMCVPETKGCTLEQITLQLSHSVLARTVACCQDQTGSRMRLNDGGEEDETNDYESIQHPSSLATMPPP